jgi:hypothetical protein
LGELTIAAEMFINNLGVRGRAELAHPPNTGLFSFLAAHLELSTVILTSEPLKAHIGITARVKKAI